MIIIDGRAAYFTEDAANYIEISRKQLTSYTDLGWIKFRYYEGKRVYFEDDLDKFATLVLMRIAPVIESVFG